MGFRHVKGITDTKEVKPSPTPVKEVVQVEPEPRKPAPKKKTPAKKKSVPRKKRTEK